MHGFGELRLVCAWVVPGKLLCLPGGCAKVSEVCVGYAWIVPECGQVVHALVQGWG